LTEGERVERPGRKTIDAAIRRILTDELRVSAAVLAACDGATPLLGLGLGLDSIEAMSLALGLERDFSIQIPDGELTPETFQSLDTLIHFIQAKIDGLAA
jgi:acyl carrier protein